MPIIDAARRLPLYALYAYDGCLMLRPARCRHVIFTMRVSRAAAKAPLSLLSYAADYYAAADCRHAWPAAC